VSANRRAKLRMLDGGISVDQRCQRSNEVLDELAALENRTSQSEGEWAVTIGLIMYLARREGCEPGDFAKRLLEDGIWQLERIHGIRQFASAASLRLLDSEPAEVRS
jgi:hypothetical protein